MRHNVIGFAPDVDPATPGILTECSNMIPTTKGMAAGNSLADLGLPELSEDARSGFVAELLDGTRRAFVATESSIVEPIGTVWEDRSRAGGYTGENRTRFTAFGNVILSTNRAEPIQQSLVGQPFEDIAGAPQALVLVSASGFVLAFNINGMTLGDVPDGWGCSAIRNHALWTPSPATQCVAGRLLDSPGAIQAAAALGGDVVAYKSTSMYLGRYVGPPLVWQWSRVPGEIGCAGAEAVVTVGTQHFFIGPDDIYSFDGTVPRPIGSPVRQFFFENLGTNRNSEIIGVADIARNLVYWHYPTENAPEGVCDACLVYNIKTDQWGHANYGATAALRYSPAQTTYDNIGASYATYDDLPDIAYDSSFWVSDGTVPGLMVGRKLYSITGEPKESSFTTGYVGDLIQMSMMRRFSPSYVRVPSSAYATAKAMQTYAGEQTALPSTASAMMRGRFDFRHMAKWHAASVVQQGAAVIQGYDFDLVPAGSE